MIENEEKSGMFPGGEGRAGGTFADPQPRRLLSAADA